MSKGPTNCASAIWKAKPITLGGPSNLTGFAYSSETGIKGPL